MYYYSADVGDGDTFNWHVCKAERRFLFWRRIAYEWQVRYFAPQGVIPTHTFRGEAKTEEAAYNRVRYLIKDRK